MASVVVRLDSLAALEGLFTRANTGTNAGAWLLDIGGSTSSSTTGPGANTAAPYVFCEASGSDATLPDISTLTVLATVIAAWVGPGRVLALRACLQGDDTYPNDPNSGLQIQGRASDGDAWAQIDLIEGWDYSDSLVVGDTVTDSLNVAHTVVQDGGWVDFEVAIPDAYQQIRLRNIPAATGSAFRHDAALWQVEFRDGGTAAEPSFVDDTGDAQSWTQDQAIPFIRVPEASGAPTPTYAVVGDLPAGIAFSPTTRILSGSPTAVGSGTITVRATNSEGTDDWTVDYTTVAPVLPDAVAPAVTIVAVASVDEGETLELVAEITAGGTYDELAYTWEIVSGGGSLSGAGFGRTYTAPDVVVDTEVIVEVTLTATGTGTNAANGTSDTDTDTESFTVNYVAPVVPTVVDPVPAALIGPIKADEIVLDGVTYTIAGPLVRQLIATYPGKIVIGDNTQDSHPSRSHWSMSDWTGGIGVNRLRGEQFIDRAWWSTMNLSHRGHVVLAPRADAVPKPAGAGEFKAWGQLGNSLYGVFGRQIRRYDGASWSAPLHTIADDFNQITNIDLGGEEYLVVAHAAGVAYSSDGTIWTETGGV